MYVYNTTTRRPRDAARYYLRPTTAYIYTTCITAIMYTCVYIYMIMYYMEIRGFRVYTTRRLRIPLDLCIYIYIILSCLCAPGGVVFFPVRPPLFKNGLANRRRCKYLPTNYRLSYRYHCRSHHIPKYNYAVL
jgi:hypothetical protein